MIDGGIGNDSINAGAGTDMLTGGAGLDSNFIAGAGDDVVYINDGEADGSMTAAPARTRSTTTPASTRASPASRPFSVVATRRLLPRPAAAPPRLLLRLRPADGPVPVQREHEGADGDGRFGGAAT